jgi:hypothetical protein
MNLLKFLKKKSDTKTDIKYEDGIKALPAGILFEDSGKLVEWAVPIEQEKLYVKKGYRADRTIYEWGEQTILKGLRLPLTTVLWKHKMEDGIGVPSIEFLAEKEAAEKYFQMISEHLHKHLGTPKNKTEEPGTFLEWKVGVVKLSLSLFEQYHTDKLVFQIDSV